MKIFKLAIAMLGASLLLSGCSNTNADKIAKIQIAAANRQAQIDKEVINGCHNFNTGKFVPSVFSFGFVARLNPAYIEVASAAEFYTELNSLLKSTATPEVKQQIATDYALVMGFCKGVIS